MRCEPFVIGCNGLGTGHKKIAQGNLRCCLKNDSRYS